MLAQVASLCIWMTHITIMHKSVHACYIVIREHLEYAPLKEEKPFTVTVQVQYSEILFFIYPSLLRLWGLLKGPVSSVD